MMINGEKAEQENLRRPKNWFHQLSQQKQDLCDGDDHRLSLKLSRTHVSQRASLRVRLKV